MNILYISKIKIFPINNGARIRSFGILKSLNDMGFNMIAIVQDFENCSYSKSLNSTRFIKYHFGKLFQVFSFQKERGILRNLNEVLKNQKIDVAVIDFKYYGQYISWLKKRDIKVIYSTHNYQSGLEFQKARKAKAGYKLFFYFYALMARIHERIFFRNADRIWVTSEEDKIKYSAFIKKNKLDILPNFVIEDWYLKTPEEEQYIIFSASFNSFQNFNGLVWFLKNVWNEKLADKTELLLAGIGSEEAFEQCKKSELYLKNIKATGFIEDMKPYISKAKLSIVPLLDGSGTRLKIIEAMALKTLVVSTSLGAQGIIKDNLIIADTAQEFRQAILDNLDGNQKKAEKAHNDFLAHYSMKYAKSKIRESLSALFE